MGPIGCSIARLAMTRNSQIEIVGAVDSNAKLIGKDLGDILGQEKTGIKIQRNGKALYKNADIVLHATTSFLASAKSQLLEFCRYGLDVVSTCEELAYPWYDNRLIAEEIDFAAKMNNVTLLGTGVNPGFVLDALAVTLSGVCENVSEIRATRILDAAKRRLPFQSKVGIGLSQEKFKQKVKSGNFGHIGLPESIAMTSAAMGMDVDRIDERIYPKIATSSVKTKHFGVVRKGKVIGLVQDAHAYSKSKRIATYHIEMYAGAKDPYDEIELIGVPNISLRIPSGTPGDIATAAIVVNSVPRVVESRSGLMTVKDLRPASSLFTTS